MPGEIFVGPKTKPAHGVFIAWLNSMLNAYVPGFWNATIQNMISLSFIQRHTCFMQELYINKGTIPSGFIIIGALSTPDPQILLFVDGVPVLHNSTDVSTLFEFNTAGRLVKFHENLTINMRNEAGNTTKTLRISFEEKYGILQAMLQVLNFPNGAIEREGIMDMIFDNRYSSTYSVELKPLEDLPRFVVRNTGGLQVEMEVPMLKDLTVTYKIAAFQSVEVPITEFSQYFFETALLLDNIEFKIKDA